MKTLILAVAIRIFIPLFVIFSVYILFRGHNHPGGGFIGGLICAIAFIFHIMAHGPKDTAYTFFTIKYFRKAHQTGRSSVSSVLVLVYKNLFRKKELQAAPDWLPRQWRVDPIFIISCGLFLAATSGVFGLFLQQPYMSALWADMYLPVFGKPGTPILFDLGVYLLVLGVVLKITFVMAEE
ncbi:cation:proton antiporter [Pontibacter qinzhouensis]|uniref:Cation:proton antiporter n=1 Tax=Pontibacter qinzhouensis TaxID=2603253 RepID=A0A5C8KA56_9BACT|nr:MnhB domain-containing protein [Pontibacter qinzhouensis]TXK51935.1 cation:proton antiporter [Pontibacter qinzhouensis]